MEIDLTPFGFTPTESQAYRALLVLGPSSGYAVAKAIGIARANAYQALDGLVSKGISSQTGQSPKRYRAGRPGDVLAVITAREADQLDRLERQVHAETQDGTALGVEIAGLRSLQEIATRAVVRSAGPVTCIAPGSFLDALAPAWRARVTARRDTAIWSSSGPPSLPIPLAGLVDRVVADQPFSGPVVLLTLEDAAIWARLSPEVSGGWSSEPTQRGLVSTTIAYLTGLDRESNEA